MVTFKKSEEYPGYYEMRGKDPERVVYVKKEQLYDVDFCLRYLIAGDDGSLNLYCRDGILAATDDRAQFLANSHLLRKSRKEGRAPAGRSEEKDEESFRQMVSVFQDQYYNSVIRTPEQIQFNFVWSDEPLQKASPLARKHMERHRLMLAYDEAVELAKQVNIQVSADAEEFLQQLRARNQAAQGNRGQYAGNPEPALSRIEQRLDALETRGIRMPSIRQAGSEESGMKTYLEKVEQRLSAIERHMQGPGSLASVSQTEKEELLYWAGLVTDLRDGKRYVTSEGQRQHPSCGIYRKGDAIIIRYESSEQPYMRDAVIPVQFARIDKISRDRM